jgi:hypothetical protein
MKNRDIAREREKQKEIEREGGRKSEREKEKLQQQQQHLSLCVFVGAYVCVRSMRLRSIIPRSFHRYVSKS